MNIACEQTSALDEFTQRALELAERGNALAVELLHRNNRMFGHEASDTPASDAVPAGSMVERERPQLSRVANGLADIGRSLDLLAHEIERQRVLS